MPRHIWSVLCAKGIVDRYTNNATLVEVIEALKITPLGPVPNGRVHLPVQLSLVSLWVRSDRDTPEHFEIRQVIILPDGSEVPSKTLTAEMQQYVRVRTFIRHEAIPFQGSGHYWIAVEYRVPPSEEWNRVANLPLDIEVVDQQPPNQDSPPAALEGRRKRSPSRRGSKPRK